MFLFLFTEDNIISGVDATNKFLGLKKSAKEAKDTLGEATNANTAFVNATRALIDLQDQSLTKMRSITQGMVVDQNLFRNTIFEVYDEVSDLGLNISDVVAAAGEISTQMKKTIMPTQDLLQNQLEFSKATGMAVKDLVTQEVLFMKLYSSQEESFKKIKDISDEAQKLGLNVSAVIKDVADNLNSLTKFKMDSQGLTDMATQAASLNTSIANIGATKLAETLWDPAKAIELSQKMQMYGGEVGKLGDAFQLMRMGAYDAKGLQEAMIDVYEEAFKIDEMGNIIDPGQVDLMQLKAQSEAMGSNLDVAIQLGRERVKQSFIEEKITNSLAAGKFDKDQLELIKSVGEIKDGKISLNIPGVGEIQDVTNATTKQMENIKEFQAKAKLDDKDIALANLTIQEDQKTDIRDIKEFLFKSAGRSTDRDNINKNIKSNVKSTTDVFKKLQEKLPIGDLFTQLLGSIDVETMMGVDSTYKEARKQEIQNATIEGEGAKDYLSTEQPFTGSKLITGEKGTIKEMIFDKEDDFLAAPRLNEILNKAKMSFDTAYTLNDIIPKPLVQNTKDMGETFAQTETKITTTNTNEIKFDPLVIKIEGVDGKLKDMLSSYENSKLMSDLIIEQFAKMPKLMGNKGVFG
jgi:hypothetical protein